MQCRCVAKGHVPASACRSAAWTDPRTPAWLHHIATNVAVTALRRQARWRWLRLTGTEAAPGHGADVATADAMRRCLLRMRPADVEVLLLYEWVGLSCAEIAALHQESAAAVRVRLSRARVRLVGGARCAVKKPEV